MPDGLITYNQYQIPIYDLNTQPIIARQPARLTCYQLFNPLHNLVFSPSLASSRTIWVGRRSSGEQRSYPTDVVENFENNQAVDSPLDMPMNEEGSEDQVHSTCSSSPPPPPLGDGIETLDLILQGSLVLVHTRHLVWEKCRLVPIIFVPRITSVWGTLV